MSRALFALGVAAGLVVWHHARPTIARAAHHAWIAVRIRWVQFRITSATADADRLATDMRQAPRQLALWRGYVVDRQIELQRLIAAQRRL